MKILYIAGRGHSGTTAFDLALGATNDFLSCGEIASGIGRHPDGICTCDDTTGSCAYWSDKLSHINAEDAEYILIADRPYSIINAITSAPSKKYSDLNGLVFSKISDGTQKIIIDSSKEVTRALRLHKIYSNDDFRCIYLIRDPRSVFQSYLKRYKKFGTINLLRKKRKVSNSFLLLCLVAGGLLYGYISFGILKMKLKNRILLVDYDSLSKERISYIAGLIKREMKQKNLARSEEVILAHPIAGNKMLKNQTMSDFVVRSYDQNMKFWQLACLLPVLMIYRVLRAIAI